MIHSARPTVSPVANNVSCCFVFVDLNSGGRTDGQQERKQLLPIDLDFGLAEWINFFACTLLINNITRNYIELARTFW